VIDAGLPYDSDAECAVLGSVLLHRDAIVSVAPWLRPAHFYEERNAWIYQAMLDCYRAQVTPNIRTITDRLRDMGKYDAVGGILYLNGLDASLPHGLDIEAYARRVERFAMLRGLVVAGGKIAALGYRSGDGLQALADAQAELTKVAALQSSDTAFVPFSAIVDDVYDDMASEAAPGIATGYTDLDRMTGGLHRGDLVILAARPGVGKTSLAGCLACNVASLHRLPVAFISLEMGRKDILMRAAALYAGLDLASIRQRKLNDDERTAFISALQWAHDQPVYIEDTASLTMQTIRNKVLRFKVERGDVGLVIVDYLQLMKSEGRKERWQEVGEISRDLKQLAREVDVPILALSQLSRAVEGRSSHVPMLSDLRESGNLEQDADMVMFIYREEMYDRETQNKGVAELHIAKHRNGPIGVVPLRFDARSTRFDDLSYRSVEGY